MKNKGGPTSAQTTRKVSVAKTILLSPFCGLGDFDIMIGSMKMKLGTDIVINLRMVN